MLREAAFAALGKQLDTAGDEVAAAPTRSKPPAPSGAFVVVVEGVIGRLYVADALPEDLRDHRGSIALREALQGLPLA